VYQLNSLTDKEVKTSCGTGIDLPKLLSLQSVKSNYGKPIDPMLLARREDGSLESFHLVGGGYLQHSILQAIRDSNMTKTQFKEHYGGVNNSFGLAEKALVEKIEEYVQSGLVNTPNRNPMSLTVAGNRVIEA
jgi:hypothetical protein